MKELLIIAVTGDLIATGAALVISWQRAARPCTCQHDVDRRWRRAMLRRLRRLEEPTIVNLWARLPLPDGRTVEMVEDDLQLLDTAERADYWLAGLN